jgi:hypothetical protein
MMNNLNSSYGSSSNHSQASHINENLKEAKEFNFPQTKQINSQYNIEKILSSIKDIKMLLHSYCLRIFDQSENYLESNKNKLIIDKTTEYNLNLIEVNLLL